MAKPVSQLQGVYNAEVLAHAGNQTLEQTDGGHVVVTDGWLTDWIVFYDHAPRWAHDGTLSINKPLQRKLNKMAQCHFEEQLNKG